MMMTLKYFAAVMVSVPIVVATTTAIAQQSDRQGVTGQALALDFGPDVDDEANLLPNGDFNTPDEQDETRPAHWQALDNLIFHWTEDPDAPERGRVIRIDTDVNQRQAYRWWIDRFVHGAELDAAPEKQPTRPPKYDTIAGLDGGFYWSDPIPVEEGVAYRVYVDAKGPPAKMFIRGYIDKPETSFADEHPSVLEQLRRARGEPERDEQGRPIRHRLRYRYTTWFPVGGTDEWRTFTHDQPRHPNNREITRDVRYIRVMFYPYWPPGEYWLDNVRVVQVEPERSPVLDAERIDLERGEVVE